MDFRTRKPALNEPCKQIDHVLINSKYVNSLRNCRAYSSIDVGSYNRILSANLKNSLRTKKRARNPRSKFNVDRLKHEETQKKFELELYNRFEELQNADVGSKKIQNWYDSFEEANASV